MQFSVVPFRLISHRRYGRDNVGAKPNEGPAVERASFHVRPLLRRSAASPPLPPPVAFFLFSSFHCARMCTKIEVKFDTRYPARESGDDPLGDGRDESMHARGTCCVPRCLLVSRVDSHRRQFASNDVNSADAKLSFKGEEPARARRSRWRSNRENRWRGCSIRRLSRRASLAKIANLRTGGKRTILQEGRYS